MATGGSSVPTNMHSDIDSSNKQDSAQKPSHTSPFAGTTVLYFHTIYTAGLCGYALAERRQRNGAEKSADIAAIVSEHYDPVPAAVLLSVLSLVCAVKVLWAAFTFSPVGLAATSSAICDLSVMAIVCLYSWTCFVAGLLLKGALFTGDTLGMLGFRASPA
ncbi:hypothetical protein PR202_gb02783 [Eleusine coracana subsp. coracana]|uniref:Uncharacterized protein n=1 Tax=Eleusine coracana subsp. coracana TaxID=191504 RepID=A0AAV5E052_ELECO|nr:hypothetical protein PR202_gb02783 [Eleusine coracana subsp. coracana]